MATANILKEVETEENKTLKKLYNVKLVNWLEKQETEAEIYAEFKNGLADPGKMKRNKLEKG